jgi:hypothetical protein
VYTTLYVISEKCGAQFQLLDLLQQLANFSLIREIRWCTILLEAPNFLQQFKSKVCKDNQMNASIIVTLAEKEIPDLLNRPYQALAS